MEKRYQYCEILLSDFKVTAIVDVEKEKAILHFNHEVPIEEIRIYAKLICEKLNEK